ncbi:hypothetical protein B0T16DRAFT_462079 [Cercophora newfieldiana]|uniref:Nephrocystin 3-like N-terminal domain-containing protein n=1 Tax=Cercophora newfieldiana TaxID=92897 RepID=A0AA40CM55_9PEZI|nr:hypothetical protein B0T16DRAFT_462079 [Cercophora newfieldiana]
MQDSSSPQNDGLRHRVRQRLSLSRFRRKSRASSRDSGSASNSSPADSTSALVAANLAAHHQNLSVLRQPTPASLIPTAGDASEVEEISLSLPQAGTASQNALIGASGLDVAIEVSSVPSDLWSAAYREAVGNLGEDIDAAILKGENVAELFKKLEELDKDASQESVFLRGVKYLQSLQVPLERFKLVLDLATPLTSIEPTTATVFGVVKGVTAIAISFSTADLEFAKKIGEMLEQLSYIDDCDTLGQRSNRDDIHKALVLVYQKLLEFYSAAFEVLSKKGVKLVVKIVTDNGRLPVIVTEFLRHSDLLRKLIQKATWEIVEDIKNMLYDQQIASWLGGDKITRQTQHHVNLRELRSDEACEFLLLDARFKEWHQANDAQQLVILGEMGSGKSMTMAFIVDELCRQSERRLPQPKICYHYCQNDGSGQTIYVLSVLILSLLEQLSGLKKGFFEWYKQKMASGMQPAVSFRALEEWLQDTLEILDRPIIFAIDGLDECDRESRDRLLKSLRRISDKASRLKIIFSSRPEEEILKQLDGMRRVVLPSDAARDKLIVAKTVEARLSTWPDDVKSLIIEVLSRSAQGSAIWTRMAVEYIEVSGITALDPMRDFLEDLHPPQKLLELYTNLYLRYTSDYKENQTLAAVALEVLAVARRPLSILELGWAVALGTTRKPVLTVEALSKLVDHRRIMRFIQPFVAHVDFDDVRKRQVKLVHQSVKEFVVGSLSLNRRNHLRQPIATPPSPTETPTQQLIENIETSILTICIKYLLLQEINITSLFSEERLALEELPQVSNLFDDSEPNNYTAQCSWEAWEEGEIHFDPAERGLGEFFVYASCYWIEHYGAISAQPLLPKLQDIELLCRADSTRLHNWIAQNCRPGCAIKPRFVFDSTLYDPLSITSLYGSEAMLHHMLETSDLAGEPFHENTVMAAADQILQWGDLSRLRLLWDSGPGRRQIRNEDFFRLVLGQWSRRPFDKHRSNWDVAFGLLNDACDMMAEEQWGSRILFMAAGTGCMAVVQQLFEAAQRHDKLRAKLQDPSQSVNGAIGAAVVGNHVDVVEYLLGQPGIDAHIQHRNARGENVLHLASRLCNPTLFRQLVPLLKDRLLETDEQGDTVLMRIVASSAGPRERHEAARILLGVAIRDDVFEEHRREALGVATEVGDSEMCRILNET